MPLGLLTGSCCLLVKRCRYVNSANLYGRRENVTKSQQTPIEIMILENLEATRHRVDATDDHLHESKDDAKFSLRLDIVECWHMLKTSEKLKPWSWFSWTFQPAVTIGDICTELARHPMSAHSKRAHALIELISLG